MAENNGMPKKKKLSEYIGWYILGAVVFIAFLWGGYVLEDTSNSKGVQLMKALKHIDDYINLYALGNAIKAVFIGNGTTMIATLLGVITGFIIVLYPLAVTGKRYHRKGHEHGSARWGKDREKALIADMKDFYNNAILAGDVFLVLDRQKRDINAMTDKERKLKKKADEKKEKLEKQRIIKLENELKKYSSPVGKKSGEFIINGTTLVKYCGNEHDVDIPLEINTIGKFAFANNNTLVKINFTSTLDTIEKGAFYNCEALEFVACKNIKNISENAFEKCKRLKSFVVEGDINNIAISAFNKCELMEFIGASNSKIQTYAEKNNVFFRVIEKNFNTSSIEQEKISVTSILSKNNAASKLKPMLNLNILILGGSGTGKSRFNVIPNLLQCNTSFAITDPSGELLRDVGSALERNGYEIKVFNLNDMEHSCNYNPFHYLKDCNGEYNENNVIKMINTYIINTKGESQGSGDPFWDESAKLFLSAICFLLIETADESQQNFSTVLDMVHKEKVVDGKEEEKSELGIIFDERKKADPKALSVKYYEEFRQAAGKTMQSILITVTSKLQNFKLEKVRNLTYADNLHLEEIGDRKTALFIIIPSTDTTYNFLAAMMYTQMFDTLYDRAITKFHGRLPVHVRFLLDEFANIGKIPQFDKVLATCRKFEISATIILQNLSQLKAMYKDDWQALPGNCDTIIYLGGKDQFTNEYISKDLGKETIDTLQINQTKARQGSSSYNNSIQGRELMTIDELNCMENSECIIMVRGIHPFRTYKYDVVNHPRYNLLREVDIRNAFYVEDKITTLPEIEYIDFSQFYDDDDLLDWEDYELIEVEYQTETGDTFIPISEADSLIDVSDDINRLFSDIKGVYSKSA